MGRFGVVTTVFLAALLSGTAMAYSTSIFTRACSSTGGVREYGVWGEVKDAYGTHFDTCVNATHVKKWFCDNGFARAVIHKCEYGCLDGECPLDSPNDMAYGYTCTATDPSKNTQIRGVVDRTKTDMCMTSNLMKKWYCSHNIAKYAMYYCPYGCVNGACRSSGEKNGYDYYQYLSISS